MVNMNEKRDNIWYNYRIGYNNKLSSI